MVNKTIFRAELERCQHERHTKECRLLIATGNVQFTFKLFAQVNRSSGLFTYSHSVLGKQYTEYGEDRRLRGAKFLCRTVTFKCNLCNSGERGESVGLTRRG